VSTGPTHAVLGLAAWGAVSLAVAAHGTAIDPHTWIAGAALTTGAALLPDLDHPPATVSRSLGPVTKALSHGVNGLSVGIYNVLRTPRDPHRDGGHRTFTHTAVFAALAGIVTTSVVSLNNSWVTGALFFFLTSLGVRGLLHEWDHKADTFVTVAGALAITVECWGWVRHGVDRAQWCGVAMVAGCLAHCVGDMITDEGCPVLWPLPFGWRLWYPIGLPSALRYRTGGRVEMVLIGPLCTVLSVWLGALALQRMGIVPWLRNVPLTPHLGWPTALR
jgi:membrane-bound metal-dependent hydrolase YbcI (DUF457 family)